MNKNKKYSDASNLLNFQYTRPLITSPITHNRKQKKSHYNKALSKAQFMQANFRFILSPLTNSLEQSLFEPDILVPWDIVDTVLVPLSEDNSLVCAVCLDLVRIPKITKCGHTYCSCCILRHMMNVERSNHSKCPVCSEVVCETDLRGVQFTSSSATQIRPGSDIVLQHLQMTRGRLCSELPSSSVTVTTTHIKTTPLSEVVPCHTAEHAAFNRITHSTVRAVLDSFEEERRELLALQHQCLVSLSSAGDSGDVESLPFVARALLLLDERRRSFEARVAQCGYVDEQDGSYCRSSIGSSKVSRFLSDRVGSNPDLQSSVVTTTAAMSSFSLRGAVTGSEISNGNADGTTLSSHSSASNGSSSVSAVQLYQSSDGEFVFLLPLCTKCLLDAAGGDAASLPSMVVGRVVEMERVVVSAESRQRVPFLRHLPLQLSVHMVEIDMTQLVSREVLARFQDELAKRAAKRRERRRQESKEKKLDDDLRLAEEVERRERLAFYRDLRARELDSIQDLLRGPAVGEGAASSTATDELSSDSAGADSSVANASSDSETAVETHPQTAAVAAPTQTASFAKITQMGGHFPSLNGAVNSSNSAATSTKDAASRVAWGRSPGGLSTGVSASALGMSPISSVSSVAAESVVWARGLKSGGGTTTTTGGKKVSLLSNSSSRSYR